MNRKWNEQISTYVDTNHNFDKKMSNLFLGYSIQEIFYSESQTQSYISETVLELMMTISDCQTLSNIL